MALKGITFDNQAVLSKFDGAFYQVMATRGTDWRIRGGNGTLSGNNVTIAQGFILVGGRLIQIDGNTSHTLTPTITNGYGRLKVEIDLTKTATESTFNQVSLTEEYSATQEGFSTLVHGDIAFSGTKYEAVLYVFQVTNSTVTSIIETMPLFYGFVPHNANNRIEVSGIDSVSGSNTFAGLTSFAVAPIINGQSLNAYLGLDGKANAGFSEPQQTSLNDVTTAGWYWINPNTKTEFPVASYGVLEVVRTSGNTLGVIVQRYTTSTLNLYERMYVNSAWTDWEQIATNTTVNTAISSKANAGFGTTTQTDLDNVMTAGWYYVNPNTTTQNMPVESYGVLQVMTTSNNLGGVTCQKFTQYAGTSKHREFERIYTNNQWYEWTEVLTAPGIERVSFTTPAYQDTWTACTYSSRETLSGKAFSYGTPSQQYDKITLPKGVYRINVACGVSDANGRNGDVGIGISAGTTASSPLPTYNSGAVMTGTTNGTKILRLSATGYLVLDSARAVGLSFYGENIAGGQTCWLNIEKVQ